MFFYCVWVLVSFFAVIGMMFCILGCLEMLALRKVRSVRKASLRVVLSGEEPQVEYLLNSLSLMADRIRIGPLEAGLEIIDGDLSEETCRKIEDYCEKNPWVVFTEE